MKGIGLVEVFMLLFNSNKGQGVLEIGQPSNFKNKHEGTADAAPAHTSYLTLWRKPV